MAYEMSKILNGLYLGNIVNSMDVRHLQQFNITHIVSVTESPRNRFADKQYLLIKADDKGSENLAQYFTQTNDFIHQARLRSCNVLVHCIKGMSRSATIVIAYIMSISQYGYQDSLRIVSAKRPNVNPNSGFLQQLATFEQQHYETERKRLTELYTSTELRDSDVLSCTMALDSWQTHSMEAQGDKTTMEEISLMYEVNTTTERDKSQDCPSGSS